MERGRAAPLAVLLLGAVFFATTGFQCGSAETTSAKLYIQQKQWEKAEQSLLKEVAKNDKNEEAWFLLGQVRFEQKRLPEMNEAFTRALALSDVHKAEIGRYRMSIWGSSYNDGVKFYNDSKATNVDATIKALESFPANIHLILGGKDKGSDYTILNDLLRQRVKRVYTIGAAAAKIESQIRNSTEITHAETLKRAVQLAALDAQPNDIVLLAPACASFDQFENYEHRGRVFKETVQALTARRS